jgi:uncharacterized protein
MSTMPNPFGSFSNPGAYPAEYGSDQAVSQAVARFFNSVYAWMCAGLGITALVAWVLAMPQHQYILASLGRGGVIALFIGELVLVGVISAAIQKISTPVATLLFLLYAGINGILFAGIFIIYPQAVLASAFAITAGMFGAMSVYGFVTHRDLTNLGAMLFMALIGLVIASVVSIFWSNGILNTLINYVGVLIFVGLTAFDTQKLKQIAVATSGNAALAARLSISGALSLYLDFLNLFLFLLRIMGDRR